jgi:hypothetical protein
MRKTATRLACALLLSAAAMAIAPGALAALAAAPHHGRAVAAQSASDADPEQKCRC